MTTATQWDLIGRPHDAAYCRWRARRSRCATTRARSPPGCSRGPPPTPASTSRCPRRSRPPREVPDERRSPDPTSHPARTATWSTPSTTSTTAPAGPPCAYLPATPASPTPPSPRPSPPRRSRPGAPSSSSSRPSTATQPSSTTCGSPPPRPRPARVRARARIAGRKAELTAVRRHLETGTGLLLVTGEAGMGKTTLVEAAARALTCSSPPATASPCRQRCPCCRSPTACAACTRPMEVSGSARPSPPARRTSHPPWPRCSPRPGREQPMHRWGPTTDNCCSRRSARRFVPWSGSAPWRSCSRTSTGPMPPPSTCWSTCSGGAHRRLSWGPGVRATTRPRSRATTGSPGSAASTPPRCSSSVRSPWRRRRSSSGCSVETCRTGSTGSTPAARGNHSSPSSSQRTSTTCPGCRACSPTCSTGGSTGCPRRPGPWYARSASPNGPCRRRCSARQVGCLPKS